MKELVLTFSGGRPDSQLNYTHEYVSCGVVFAWVTIALLSNDSSMIKRRDCIEDVRCENKSTRLRVLSWGKEELRLLFIMLCCQWLLRRRKNLQNWKVTSINHFKSGVMPNINHQAEAYVRASGMIHWWIQAMISCRLERPVWILCVSRPMRLWPLTSLETPPPLTAHTHTHTLTQAYTHTSIHTCTHRHMWTHTHTLAKTSTGKHKHTTQQNTHTCTYTSLEGGNTSPVSGGMLAPLPVYTKECVLSHHTHCNLFSLHDTQSCSPVF